MGYTHTDTFIAVAEDCRAATGEVPPERAGSGSTVASTQYAMLAAAPGRWTQEDVLLASSPPVGGQDIDALEPRRQLTLRLRRRTKSINDP